MSESHDRRELFTMPHPIEALALIALFGAAVLFIASVLSVYGIPYGLDFGEGYLANMSLELVRGNNPYHSLDRPPWIVSSYPPLFPFINGLIMSVLGPSLLPGRFIATASLIGILATSVLILRRLGAGATVAILAVGMLLVFPWSVRWSQVVRVDTLGILFAVAGLYRWIRSGRFGDCIFAAVLFAAAVLTKHSLVAAPLACLVYAFVSRDSRRWIFLALLIILIGGSYGILIALTGGGLYNHLVTYTANEWFLGRFTAGIGDYFKATWILQILAVAGFFIPGTVSGQMRLLGWYYLFANLTLIAYGLEGSDTNYYIEPLLATALLSGLALDRLTSSPETARPVFGGIQSTRTIAYALILVIFIVGRYIDVPFEAPPIRGGIIRKVIFVVDRYVNAPGFQMHRANGERIGNGMELVRLTADVPGDVLCEDASFTLLAGKKVWFQPYIMSLLARTGKWNQDEFVSTIKDRDYALIILRVDLNDPYNTERSGGAFEVAGFDRWTNEMEDAIREQYYLYGPVDTGTGNDPWYIYLPRPDEDKDPDSG